MSKRFDPDQNREQTKTEIGYVSFADANDKTYADLGFICGLEIHQQLATEKKLFCRCPVGVFQEPDDFDAEIVRHMRPTLSEMGEYDGTALMERRTRKNIVYRLKAVTACTYEIDDTPPFPLNQQALDISIEIALMLKSNVVGELHITRKQYLDGSIPTGFQRTAIVGVGGEIRLRNKTIRMIQMSLEEDSCREVSDIGHWRVYRTDRLGMPLIEMVTHPDMKTPAEAKEAGDYLRYLSRSSGKVRTGMGAGRQDVNVSITGGTRIEIKGVAHTKWIPKLTHNEAFRQKALLTIRDRLTHSGLKRSDWKCRSEIFALDKINHGQAGLFGIETDSDQFALVVLPGFHGQLSHFTQPGQTFADEIAGRLKVIACLEHPNMLHTEMVDSAIEAETLRKLSGAKENDAVLLLRGNKADLAEAIATIEERCLMAFDGVPNETRKSFPDGTTIFERVLPGADRMYPDTDSAPIGITEERIDAIRQQLVTEIAERQDQYDEWKIAPDAQAYLLQHQLIEPIRACARNTGLTPRWLGHWFGHRVKHLEGQYGRIVPHDFLFGLIEHLHTKDIEHDLSKQLAPLVYKQPGKSYDEYLDLLPFKPTSAKGVSEAADNLSNDDFRLYRRSDRERANWRWRMGRLAPIARGNVSLADFSQSIAKEVTHG